MNGSRVVLYRSQKNQVKKKAIRYKNDEYCNFHSCIMKEFEFIKDVTQVRVHTNLGRSTQSRAKFH